MGFLDRFKKKKASGDEEAGAQETSSEESVEDEPEPEPDPVSDSGDDVDIDSISVDEDGSEPQQKPKKAAMDPDKKKKLVIVVLLFFLFVSILIGAAVWYYMATRLYPAGKKLTESFFKTLNQSHNNKAYNMYLDNDYRSNYSDQDFRYIIEGSAFLFTEIKTIEPLEDTWRERGKDAMLSGRLIYIDKSEGEFDVHIAKREKDGKTRLAIQGFEVRCPERIEREHKDAYRTMTEFLKTFEKDKMGVFGEFLHPFVKEKWGQDSKIKILQLHSRLTEAGFVEFQFPEDNVEVKSNVELLFTGKARTKLGTDMRGAVSVFFTKGTWFINGVDFRPL